MNTPPCRNLPNTAWYPPATSHGGEPTIPSSFMPRAPGLWVCLHACPQRAECAERAFGNNEHGVWGGLTQRQRKLVSKAKDHERHAMTADILAANREKSERARRVWVAVRAGTNRSTASETHGLTSTETSHTMKAPWPEIIDRFTPDAVIEARAQSRGQLSLLDSGEAA